jgi:anti-sigma factor RsiW
MSCTEARPLLHDLRRRRLAPDVEDALRSHLAGCAECRSADAAEGVLDDLLSHRLPRHAAPPSLKRRLADLTAERPRRETRRSWARLAAPALAAGLAVVTGALLVERQAGREAAALSTLSAEAVSDHLRVLASQHPLEVESGGSHQVKPWFEGKLDFAPDVPLPEVADLRLLGGAVGYFLDRKAAVVEYALRRHAVTLLVFRADGLRWPARAGTHGPVPEAAASVRGFNVVLWQANGLGYALVSDVNPGELTGLASRFAATARP